MTQYTSPMEHSTFIMKLIKTETMKTLIVSLALCISAFISIAQEQSADIDYLHYADSVTASLDVSKIPYGVLYDKVEPLSNLDIFVQGNDSTRSSAVHFFQALHEFYYAYFDTFSEVSSASLLARHRAWEQMH